MRLGANSQHSVDGTSGLEEPEENGLKIFMGHVKNRMKNFT